MIANKAALKLIGLALILTLSACSGSRGPTSGAPSQPSPVPRDSRTSASNPDAVDEALEIEALLLLIGDRRVLEPIVVSRALESPITHLRWRAALVLGQIGDARASGALSTLLTDRDPAVRQAAALALGRLSDATESIDEGIDARLLRAAVDADRDVGIRAVEALARRGVAIEQVASALVRLESRALLERLMPSLFRFRGPAVLTWAELGLETGLETGDPTLRRWAAYGLAREPMAESAEALRALLEDEDAWIAGWAARALGRVGDRSDLARLTPLLMRPESGPVVQALRAARALIDRGAAAPPDTWRDELLALIDDPRTGVRITALEVVGSWLRDESLGTALAETALAETARPRDLATERERVLALAALAGGADPRAEGLVLDAQSDASPVVRSTAAAAASTLGMTSTLARFADDADAGVRATVVALRLGPPSQGQSSLGQSSQDPSASIGTASIQDVLGSALADEDPGPRAVALGWLAAHAELAEIEARSGIGHDAMLAAMPSDDRLPDARLAGISALSALAVARPVDRDRVIGSLEMLANARDYVVRRAASRAIGDLGRPAPPLGPATRKAVVFYREIVEQTRQPYRLRMETARGSVDLELDCRQAPIGCLSFVQLARQGFYDGLRFHRVVADFVVQAGDPRGDGRGGPGFRVRSEPTLMHYGPGVLGMARGAPDTAGSQFFITLSEQPHLDGDYTAFGHVTTGLEVLDTIVQGDTIESFVAMD